MMEVKYHPKALAEIFQSADWYDKRQPGLGNELFQELDLSVLQITNDPERFVPDADGVRSVRLSRFPFRVRYVIDPDRIRILAVAHAKRRPGYWQKRMSD